MCNRRELLTVTVVAFSNSRGGAAKAAFQQVKAISKLKNLKVSFVVAEKHPADGFAVGPCRLEYYGHFTLRCLSYLLSKLQFTKNQSKHSLNIFSSSHVIKALNMDSDCIHLHWFNNDTLSISSLSRFLTKKNSRFIITLHDEWLFSGSEHCVAHNSKRYLEGYSSSTCDVKGLDLDRWTFNRKIQLKKLFEKSNVVITAPSDYMKEKAKSSYLLANANIVKVPNIINCDEFKPRNVLTSRLQFGLPPSSFIIAFGAIGGGNYLKGNDLLYKALDHVKLLDTDLDISLVTFGGSCKETQIIAGYKVFNLGHIDSKSDLVSIYSSADVTVVPSRVESFGQVAAESLACETPVIAFDNSGLTDIIQTDITGMLVPAFDTKAFASAIIKILTLPAKTKTLMGYKGRQFVLDKFSPDAVSCQWSEIYNR